MNRTLLTGLVTVSMLGSLGCMAGCLVSGSNNQAVAGSYVSRETLDRIEPGVTTAAWVEATLGMPTSRKTLDDGTEIWRYSYVRTKTGHGSVLFLFKHSDSNTQAHTTIVEFKDGVVTRAWQD